jgi:hypothetical protein
VPVAMSLDFTKIRCAHCRSFDRIAGLPCPDCLRPGRPDEVNGKVVTRRQAVSSVRASLRTRERAASEPLPYYFTRAAWRVQIADRLGRALLSLARVSEQPRDSSRHAGLVDAIADLKDAEFGLSQLPIRRPFVRDLQARRATAHAFVEMAELYLQAFEADSPLAAQKLAGLAQQEIDRATEAMNEVDAEKDLLDEFDLSTRGDFFGGVLGLFERLRPNLTFLEVDATERVRLERKLGRKIADNFGAEYLLRESVVRVWFDPDRFRECVRNSLLLFNSDDRVRAIADESGALGALARARDALLESVNTFDIAVSQSTSDHDRLRRVMALYRELFEDAAMPVFAWFLRVAEVKSAPISNLIRKDATDLLRSIDSRSDLSDLFFGADPGIRNAASHGLAYELSGEDVVISLRAQTRTISVDVLIDLVLALLESLLATFWVLDNELARLDYTAHNSGLALSNASLLPVARAVLDHLNGNVISAEEREGDEWTFVIGGRPKVDPWILATAMAAQMSLHISSATIHFPDLPAGRLVINFESYEAWKAADTSMPTGSILGLFGLLESSSIDGHDLLEDAGLRKITSLGAIELVINDQSSAVRLLRECRRVGLGRGLGDVVELSELALLEWRHPDPIRRLTLLRLIGEWNDLPVPRIPRVAETSVRRSSPAV